MTVRRALVLAALAGLMLAGCHKRESADGMLDAAADARARTAAKTLADLTAAERASATPLPRVIASPPERVAPPAAVEAPTPADPLENDAEPNL